MGKLFVIEGTDGSGKQTQFECLRESLKKNNIEFMEMSFPNYNSPSSELVKMYLNGCFGDDALSVDPYVASTFYAADRFATYNTGEYKKFYENGGIIIADRYTTGNMVHQAGKIDDIEKREKFLDWLADFEFNIYKLPKPTEVFFLDMPPYMSKKLRENRKNKITNETKKDIHESNDKFMEKSYDAACYVANKYNWNRINSVINGSVRKIEDIHNEIFEKLMKSIK